MVDARIALDAMGGDRAPRETVRGALEALERDPSVSVVLVGDQGTLEREIAEGRDQGNPRPGDHDERLSIHHAPLSVGSGEAARMGLTKGCSVRVGTELVREGAVDGLVAAGNTGATVAAAHFLIKLLPGVLRPGIAVTLPTAKGETILCDAGANIHCKPLHLLHYGIMAARWSKAVFGHDSPTVGLLNIGSEEGKGNELVRETSALFTDAGLNFLGNVEGNDVFNGRCDVIVCEGFVGNVVLKTAEGLYEVIASRVKELMRDITTAFTACGAPMASLQEAVGRFRGNMDWAEHGGAPLLGLNGLVLISHGRSDARAIRNAILQAARIHRKQVLRAMAKDLVADASKSAS